MKGKKKALATALCVALIAAGALAGTMAYFTDKDAATNTFTVGKVAITLDEAKVDEAGKKIPEASRVHQNTYHLIPGYTYDKDPIVHVAADSSECYVYVTVNNAIEKIEGTNTVAAQMKANGWETGPVLNELPVYVYKTTVNGGENLPVFAEFTIAGESTNNTMLASYDGQVITVTAYAVQAAGFGTAQEAWNSTFGA